jgi:hypothetical protein
VSSHFGSWSPDGLPNIQREIARVQNPYIIGKLLECRCLKWVCMTDLDTSNISYGQKKGQKSNWQFDSRSLKVNNLPIFLMCRWCATYHWKTLNEGYNFFLDLILIKVFHTKLWPPKVTGVLTHSQTPW